MGNIPTNLAFLFKKLNKKETKRIKADSKAA